MTLSLGGLAVWEEKSTFCWAGSISLAARSMRVPSAVPAETSADTHAFASIPMYPAAQPLAPLAELAAEYWDPMVGCAVHRVLVFAAADPHSCQPCGVHDGADASHTFSVAAWTVDPSSAPTFHRRKLRDRCPEKSPTCRVVPVLESVVVPSWTVVSNVGVTVVVAGSMVTGKTVAGSVR